MAIAKNQNKLYKFSQTKKNYKIWLNQKDMRVTS